MQVRYRAIDPGTLEVALASDEEASEAEDEDEAAVVTRNVFGAPDQAHREDHTPGQARRGTALDRAQGTSVPDQARIGGAPDRAQGEPVPGQAHREDLAPDQAQRSGAPEEASSSSNSSSEADLMRHNQDDNSHAVSSGHEAAEWRACQHPRQAACGTEGTPEETGAESRRHAEKGRLKRELMERKAERHSRREELGEARRHANDGEVKELRKFLSGGILVVMVRALPSHL